MKQVLILLLLVPSVAFSKASLSINFTTCNPKFTMGIATKNLKIIKDQKIIFEKEDAFGKYFENLDTGTYLIQCQDFYGYQLADSINILQDEYYSKTICLDNIPQMPSSFKSLIDSISELNPLIIEKEFRACFAACESELKIVKVEGKYFAYYKQYEPNSGRKKVRVRKTRQLDSSAIDRIRQFEYELNIISRYHGGCCLTDYYTLKIGTTKKEYADKLIGWDGVHDLVKSFK